MKFSYPVNKLLHPKTSLYCPDKNARVVQSAFLASPSNFLINKSAASSKRGATSALT